MTEDKLPPLTEAHVRELASEKGFERGETYYHDGAVLEPARQASELRARCEGPDYEPYRVSATPAEGGVAETSCTCPYDYGGFVLGLSQCLKKSEADAETRRAWLATLLEAELADIEMGGVDLAPSAREAVPTLGRWRARGGLPE